MRSHKAKLLAAIVAVVLPLTGKASARDNRLRYTLRLGYEGGGSQTLSGGFSIAGQTLALSDLEAALEGGGRLEGSASLSLEPRDE